MHKEGIAKYVLSLLKSVEKELLAFQKKKEPEMLHRIRVDIKKMRAILSFLNYVFKEEHFSEIRTLMPLFHRAGAIRELQINNKLLNGLPHRPMELIRKLKEKEKTATRKFYHTIPQHCERVNNLRCKMRLPDEILRRKQIRKYFRKKIKKARRELDMSMKNSSDKKREAMHDFRMDIKKMMYVYKVLPGKMRQSIGLETKYINKLQEKAGEWHDTYAVINFLHSIRPVSVNYVSELKEKEKNQFKVLLKYCKKFRIRMK